MAFPCSVCDHYLEAIDHAVITGAVIRTLRVLGIAIINGTVVKADDLKLALIGVDHHRIVGGSLCNIRPGDGCGADSCAGCQQHRARDRLATALHYAVVAGRDVTIAVLNHHIGIAIRAAVNQHGQGRSADITIGVLDGVVEGL